MYLVEEPSLDALLHDARGTHADVLVACDRLRLLYGAFESVRDERKRGSFVDPLLWDRAAENKDRHVQRVFATPPVGEVERPSTEHQRPCRFARLFEELGGLCRDHEDHVGSRQPVFGVASGVPGQEPLAADSHGCFWAVIRPTYEPVKRDGEPCADFAHARSPSSPDHLLEACVPQLGRRHGRVVDHEERVVARRPSPPLAPSPSRERVRTRWGARRRPPAPNASADEWLVFVRSPSGEVWVAKTSGKAEEGSTRESRGKPSPSTTGPRLQEESLKSIQEV